MLPLYRNSLSIKIVCCIARKILASTAYTSLIFIASSMMESDVFHKVHSRKRKTLILRPLVPQAHIVISLFFHIDVLMDIDLILKALAIEWSCARILCKPRLFFPNLPSSSCCVYRDDY